MSVAGRIHRLISRAMRTAAPATAATTAAVAICGYWEEGEAVAPINAISHILWGDSAVKEEGTSIQYTAAGVALNTLAVTSWSLIYEAFFGQAARKGNTSAAVLGGVTVAGLAYVTDYCIVPKRLTPGFEKRLSPASMLIVYSALAASLPLTSLLERQAKQNDRSCADPATFV